MTVLNEKQIKILHVAEKLFAEKGFDGTSIRNISKEAGINIAMVSYYFGSKEKMLESLIFNRTSGMKMMLDNLLREPLEPFEKLDKLIELYISRVTQNRCIYQIVHTEMNNVKRQIDVKLFTDVKRENLRILEQIINEGQQKGVFSKNVNIALIPTTILGIYFQFQNSRPFYEEIFDLKTDEAFEDYIKTELTTHIKKIIKAFLTNEN